MLFTLENKLLKQYLKTLIKITSLRKIYTIYNMKFCENIYFYNYLIILKARLLYYKIVRIVLHEIVLINKYQDESLDNYIL